MISNVTKKFIAPLLITLLTSVLLYFSINSFLEPKNPEIILGALPGDADGNGE